MDNHAGYIKGTLRPVNVIITLLVMCLVTVAVAGGCSLIGQARLTEMVWRLRLYRLAAAFAVGSGLASAGVALQGLLKNPLAEPYVLGISSGAGVGVLLGYAISGAVGLAGWATTPVLAIIGAAITSVVVFTVAQRRGQLDPYALLLSGVIVNAFNGAIMLTIFLLVPPRTITSFAGWIMGRLTDSIAISNPLLVIIAIASVVVGEVLLFFRGVALNALGLGDEVAASVGVAVGRLRIEMFVIVSLMTAAAVALAGPIGFLGLIVPHICRLIVGPDHRRLVIVSSFSGAIFLMLADTFCRTAGQFLRVGEIPVGILTALTGGPFFIFLLRRSFREAKIR